jgi:23S rRNA (cytosine1962-C5)-methyltransferase
VLDAFSGTGGFGLAALVDGGALSVTAIDSSPRALERLELNAAANHVADRVTTEQADGFKALRALCDTGRKFGAVSLDPPRFATSRREVEGALRGYRELNLRAIGLVEPGGLLATSSCTSVVDEEAFLRVVRDAAADAGRRVQVLRTAGQALDHPWLTAVPEGRYLKHALLRVVPAE